MTIFDAIINNNLEKVKGFIESGQNKPDDLEPEFFEGRDGSASIRRNPKTVLGVAQFLNRQEIAEYLLSKLEPKEIQNG